MNFLSKLKGILTQNTDSEDTLTTKSYVDGKVAKTGDTMTGKLKVTRLEATTSASNDPGLLIRGNRPNLTFATDKITGGVAFSIMNAKVNNNAGETQVGMVGVYGGAGDGTSPPSGTYMYFDGRSDGSYNKATLKIASTNRVGVAISSSGSPTQALDVNGKIRMRTQTAPADNDDIVATKKYVDDNKYTHPAVNHIPASGNSGQFLGWDSSGKAKWVDAPSGGGPASEMVGKSTIFNSNGSITENYVNGDVMLTIFNSNGSITEEFTPSGGTKITKTTTFNQDGSIDEVIT